MLAKKNTERLVWLYVPADRASLMRKALYERTPDVVILDLEDAVIESRKSEARENVGVLLRSLSGPKLQRVPQVHVRINSLESEHSALDLRMLKELPNLAGVRIPKVEHAADITVVQESLGDPAVEIHCLIESSRGIESVGDICESPGVSGVSLGEADLRAELEVEGDELLDSIRHRLVVCAAAHGLPRPVMSVFPNIRDLDGLRSTTEKGRRAGYLGRTAIHPNQMETIRAAFRPNALEMSVAKQVVEHHERTGLEVFALTNGMFVDAPILTAAYRTLSRQPIF